MKYYFFAFLLGSILVACNSNNDPYANKFGIKSSVVAQIDTAGYTYITWMDSVKDLGQLKPRESILLYFTFQNTGSTPLYISSVSVSCGCTAVNYPSNPVSPKQTGTVTVRFNAKNYLDGYFRKTVGVTTNTRNKRRHILVFSGFINHKA
jgi:hypothetical protein